jgi:hypothetical protein
MADAPVATSPTKQRPTRKRPPSVIARTASTSPIGVSHRRPRRRRHIQDRWRANPLCKDRRKRRKTGARILPPMWNANLLDCRRRRAEIVLQPCGDCTPTRCACPDVADLVSLATALGHRPGLRSQAGQIVSCGADKDAWNQFSGLSVSCDRESRCIALRQRSIRTEHNPGDRLALVSCN